MGQSGSGKSTMALAILGLLGHTGAAVSGQTMLLGRDLMDCNESQLREVRGRLISLVPQSPVAALNPSLRIEAQLREAWRAHSREPWSCQKERVAQRLEGAGLSSAEAFLRRFPRQISVGQAQRMLIVMALLHAPPLLIADEPTSALDVINTKGGSRSTSHPHRRARIGHVVHLTRSSNGRRNLPPARHFTYR